MFGFLGRVATTIAIYEMTQVLSPRFRGMMTSIREYVAEQFLSGVQEMHIKKEPPATHSASAE